MAITVNRYFPFQGSGGMMGFASVTVDVGESKITLESLTLRTSAKDGKMYLAAASQQDKKDTTKWNPLYKVEGQLWWDITNAVIAAHNGAPTGQPTTASETTQTGDGTGPTESIAVKKVWPFGPKGRR